MNTEIFSEKASEKLKKVKALINFLLFSLLMISGTA
jgi:hypothetical protein